MNAHSRKNRGGYPGKHRRRCQKPGPRPGKKERPERGTITGTQQEKEIVNGEGNDHDKKKYGGLLKVRAASKKTVGATNNGGVKGAGASNPDGKGKTSPTKLENAVPEGWGRNADKRTQIARARGGTKKKGG